MDKTDKVLKQFSKPEPMMVTPVGSDVIVPNLSGITGNKDAMNKLTLQQVTTNGAVTNLPIQITNASNTLYGETTSQRLLLNTTTGANMQFNTSNSIGIGNGTQTYQAGGQNVVRISSGGMAILKGASNPVASAGLEIVSTSKGFLPPVMTTAQKNAISSPATGLIVFDTDLGKLCVYSGGWQTVTSA